MGLVHATVRLSNPARPELAPVELRCLADTGATYLVIPEHVALQLKLDKLEDREITLADGRKMVVPYVGPVRVQAFNRNCFVGALVMGDEVLLGAIPMEDMDLVVDPQRRELRPNPASPNIPAGVVKGAEAGGQARRERSRCRS